MLAEMIAFVLANGGNAATRQNDWLLTFIAQIVNFLILVVLLRYVLYGRVVRAMDKRDNKIASHFESAEQKEKEAEEKAESVERAKAEFEQKRDSMLREAEDDAEKHRRDLTQKARQEVEGQAGRWRDDLEREKESFLRQMQHRAGEQVCTIARRALADLADDQLERRMVDMLIRRLDGLPDEDRRELADAMKDSTEGLLVATAWELPDEDRRKVAEAAGKHIAGDTQVRFETAPELTCGIELRAAGREIAWTLEGYVQGIREHLAEAIDEKIEAASRRAEPSEPEEEGANSSQPAAEADSGAEAPEADDQTEQGRGSE